MLKNLTISGKVNLITEIIAIITWAILLIAAKDDWQFFAVFSVPLLILIPICGWFLMPVSKKISEKGKTKNGLWKAAWYRVSVSISSSDSKYPTMYPHSPLQPVFLYSLQHFGLSPEKKAVRQPILLKHVYSSYFS